MNKKTQTIVTPAILTKTFEDMQQKISLVASFVPRIQIDAADGVFVPNATWPYVGDENHRFESIIKQEEGFPGADEVSFEIDLMVQNPMFEADKWIAAGASALVVHIQSIDLAAFAALSKNIKSKGIELILGVEMSASLEDVRSYIKAATEAVGITSAGAMGTAATIDGIQCMGIRREGFQHQAFDPEVLKKIAEIHSAYPDILISVDGGVSLENARALHDAGASRLVAGSSVFDSESIQDTLKKFVDIF